MKVWRIRLKNTGLYYQPVTGRWNDTKSHLSIGGKVYIFRRPSLKSIGKFISVSHSIANKYNLPVEPVWHSKDQLRLSGQYEFEIVEYECVEVTNADI